MNGRDVFAALALIGVLLATTIAFAVTVSLFAVVTRAFDPPIASSTRVPVKILPRFRAIASARP